MNNWMRSLLAACTLMLALPLSAQAAVQIIPGKNSTGTAPGPSDPPVPAAAGPVTIFVGDNGSLQAKRGAQFEGVSGMFLGPNSNPGANFWHLRVKGAPAENVTFGPRDTPPTCRAGACRDVAPTQISNVLTPGAFTAASPARVDTVMRAGTVTSGDLFEITQTVLYVAPELRYRVIWAIRNISGQPLPFVFGTSADLFIESDAGRGVFVPTAPRFVGGTGFTGKTGGIEEVIASQLPGEAGPTAVPPWASYEEGDPYHVTRRLSSGDAFLNTINPAYMDNGAGVSWNDRATTPLPAGQTARYEVVWHLERPGVTALAEPPAAAPAVSPAGGPEVPPAPPSATADATGTGPAGAPTAANPGTRSAAIDEKPPVLSALRVAPTAGDAPKVVFRLSERADVVLRIVRRTKRRQVTVRRLTRANLRPGTRTIAPGVGSGAKRLKPGSYVVFAQAVDAAGNRGARRSAAFRVTR